ncbi:uncharacterized protein LOC134278510 isoform X2 [Saccostrea cucullata]|uniref:uncharacterized protein LOC134278510 isoform X2 n=1 Tax=Saccostrea cuccullata TaxID=36930 RepID=UPI002ED46AEF
MEPAIRTIVDGEASESDDDEDSVENEEKKEKKLLSEDQVNAVSISGEASESEDEEIPPIKVDTRQSGLQDPPHLTSAPKLYSSKPKYDSLLHKKLREKNAGLRRHLVDSVHQMYLASAKDLHNTSLQLHKSQALIMDVNHNMKLLTNDLFSVVFVGCQS